MVEAVSSAPNYDTELGFNRLEYLDITNQLNNYNEIYSMNQYVAKINKTEQDSIVSMNSTLKTQLYKLRQMYFLIDYSNHNIKFWTNILYFTTCMICITFICIAFFNSTLCKTILEQKKMLQKADILFYIALLSLTLIYIIVVIIALANKVMRRKYSWDQFYYKKNIS